MFVGRIVERIALVKGEGDDVEEEDHSSPSDSPQIPRNWEDEQHLVRLVGEIGVENAGDQTVVLGKDDMMSILVVGEAQN